MYGVTGSGKTTLAARISGCTGVPWHSVDDLTWLPDWVEVDLEEQRERIRRICQQDAWILDTAYGKWREIPLARAELIVALDYPRWVSLGRLLQRTVARVRDRRPICGGNVETLRGSLSRDSILLWHFRSFGRKRAQIRRWQAEGRPIVVLHSQAETDRWLEALTPVSEVAGAAPAPPARAAGPAPEGPRSDRTAR